jgi:hypothetical protein
MSTHGAHAICFWGDEGRGHYRTSRAAPGYAFAIKDLVETAGLRTTYDSPLFADNVPEVGELVAARIRRRRDLDRQDEHARAWSWLAQFQSGPAASSTR